MYEIETQLKNKHFILEVRIYLIKSWFIRSPIEIIIIDNIFAQILTKQMID